ncbi:MAG: class I SAM-dependent rRNA methyltransferase [Planctomycetota bacterium]
MVVKVLLKSRKAKPFWFGEPWVFDGSVDRIKGRAQLSEGAIVEVCDDRGIAIGSGFYSGKSPIRVRMLTRGTEVISAALIRRRLQEAVALREKQLELRLESSVYRLVHSEGDGLPGLIVDRCGDYLVLNFDNAGIRVFRKEIVETLQTLLQPKGQIERSSRAARDQEGLTVEEGTLAGEAPTEPVEVIECGVRYRVDILHGQKTGFYCDQRLNRQRIRTYAHGRKVLDAFSYTAAFGINALKAGALEVLAVDSSAPALAAAEENAALNSVSGFSVERANVLRFLDHARKDPAQRWGLVVLDPPKLVPKRSDLRRGMKLYREINAKGIAVVEDGGFLATCSCSGSVSDHDFDVMVASAAEAAGRGLQLLESGGAGPDHPARLPHLLSRYLKFRVYRVTGTVPTAPTDPFPSR